MKTMRYMGEAILIHLIFLLFKLLPADLASDIGGWIGRTIGPRLGASRKAVKNIEMAMPGAHIAAIVTAMWDNLGRTMAEYPHLKTLIEDHTEVHGYLPEGGTGQFIFFSGHLANWEMSATGMRHFFGITPQLIYRAPNNPYLQNLLDECRSLKGAISTIPKSSQGARDMMRALREGESLGILIDQKYNEGLPADFFGRPAMTSPAFVQLAQKYDLPLIPVRPERLKGCRFRITVYPPIPTKDRPVEDVIADAHRLLEQWITERPGQWLWLHRRWNSKRMGQR